MKGKQTEARVTALPGLPSDLGVGGRGVGVGGLLGPAGCVSRDRPSALPNPKGPARGHVRGTRAEGFSRRCADLMERK